MLLFIKKNCFFDEKNVFLKSLIEKSIIPIDSLAHNYKKKFLYC